MQPHSTDHPSIGQISFYTLAVLVLADVVLIAIYAASVMGDHLFGLPMTNVADLNQRYGLASSYNYSKYLLAGVFLLVLAIVHRRSGYGWLAGLSVFFLADDVLEAHDKLGVLVGRGLDFGPLAAMHPQDRGEPLIYAGMLAITVAFLVVARRSLCGAHRGIWLKFTLAVAGLAFFGAGVDVLHGMVKAALGDGAVAGFVDTLFIALEDGGEGVMASVMVWVAIEGLLNAVRTGETALAAPVKAWLQGGQAATGARG